MVMLPSAIGFQDLGALLARQPAVAERWREHLIASPFGTIHAATFSLPRPVGTLIPHPPLYALANFDPLDITEDIGALPLGDPNSPLLFPKVNRKSKRDAFLTRPREPLPPLPPMLEIAPLPAIALESMVKKEEVGRVDPYAQYEFGAVPDEPSKDTPPAEKDSAAARVFFGADPLAPREREIARWAPGEAPRVKSASASGDPDVKLSALEPGRSASADEGGESVASKGQATAVHRGPYTPAERLALTGAARAKAEKCLANAVYFEARGEPVRGQIAVAQVVMNRVFSPFYPNNVCDVVYQNANRHLACQFTFACDGIPDVVTESDAWARAQHIARDVLDGKVWMPEVAKSTHYHAQYVHPYWVSEMKKMYKLGIHTFYRPRAWGDGSDEPSWGSAKAIEQAAKR